MSNMNNNLEKNNKIKEIVLAKIKSGQAKMKPKWHFVLRSVLLVSGIIILSIALFYLVSFILFALRQTGVLFMPAFGLAGVKAFFVSLPWILILVSIIFIIALEILVRQYSFAYRKTFLYSLFAIILFIVLGGWVTFASGLHQGLFNQATQGKLPVAGPLYRGMGFGHPQDVYVGKIEKIGEKGLDIQNQAGEKLEIKASPETRFPFGTDFEEGDTVMVFGKMEKGSSVEAIGIHCINDKIKNKKRVMPGPPEWRFPIKPKTEKIEIDN